MSLHVLADPRASGWILEPLDQLAVSSVMSPGWNDRRQIVEPSGICVSVRGDAAPRVASFLDVGDYLGHAAPVGLPCRFQVPNLDGDASLAANPYCLVQRRDDRIALVSDMRGID